MDIAQRSMRVPTADQARCFKRAKGSQAAFYLQKHRLNLSVAVSLLLFFGAFADPVSAQESDTAGWIIEGGPVAGTSIYSSPQFEYGLRIGARRGTRVLDASISTFTVRFNVPPATQRSYEALAGAAWHFGSNITAPGIGFRAGLTRTPNVFGEYTSAAVLGPHTSVSLPLGPALALRGEAGFHVYVSALGPGGPRGYLRLGLEGRSR
jgi:hypothetical protein